MDLSERCLSISPSVTLAIDAKAKEMSAAGIDVVGFGAGEPDFPTPEYIRQAAKQAIDRGMTRYTPVQGTLALREAIAAKFLRDNGLIYSPAEVIVSGGAKQSLFIALSALLNPGDEVLLPSPCWLSYPEMVRMAGGVPVLVPGDAANNFVVTADMLRPHVTARTKALILNSPSNPNGHVLQANVLRGIAELAVEREFYVISDEIYEKLVYGGCAHISIASLGEAIRAQTVVVNGVSKTYAMTGWRIGYAAGPRPIIQAMTAHQSHSSSNPNSIAQYATQAALAGGEDIVAAMVAEFDARRLLMHRLVSAIPGLAANLPDGAFYMMVNLSGILGRRIGGRVIDDSMAFAAALLAQKSVAVVPGKAFGDDRHVRLSYAVSRAHIEKGIARIAEFIAETEG
ncbi:MAG: pyridoxal phosphate-dependent aminotransferase [Clostridiales bacterium]|nr:pyridoxal phosphate-dependent aminotransferase [Clostridiales bacterium]